MPWNPDSPFPASSALGETDSGARNLPSFLCSLLDPGPVLVLGACEIALAAADRHEVVVVDWNHRRLAALDAFAARRGLSLTSICRDPERQGLGVGPRRVTNVVCLDVLERFKDEVGVLEKLQRTLEPGGKLVVRVRACPWVTETVGRAPSAPRLHDPETLRESLEEASFRTLKLRHWNFLGVPGALVWDRCLGRPHRDEGGAPSSERPRHWWDSALDVWYRTVENRVGFPAGVSLVAVATPYLEKSRVRREVLAKDLSGRGAREAYEPMATSRCR